MLALRVKGSYAALLITCPSREEGERIARALVGAKLAACVNMVPGVKSIYWWRGYVEEGEEVLLLVKTRLDLVEELAKKVRSLHSYEVPEIIALPIVSGSKSYLDWLDESLAT